VVEREKKSDNMKLTEQEDDDEIDQEKENRKCCAFYNSMFPKFKLLSKSKINKLTEQEKKMLKDKDYCKICLSVYGKLVKKHNEEDHYKDVSQFSACDLTAGDSAKLTVTVQGLGNLTEQEIKLIKWWREVKALKDKNNICGVIMGLETANEVYKSKVFTLSINELEKLREIL